MKLAFIQLKKEMNELDCGKGNFSHLPLRFASNRKIEKEQEEGRYYQNPFPNNSSQKTKKNSLSIERVSLVHSMNQFSPKN